LIKLFNIAGTTKESKETAIDAGVPVVEKSNPETRLINNYFNSYVLNGSSKKIKHYRQIVTENDFTAI